MESSRMPTLMKVAIIVAAAPVLAYPWLLASITDASATARTLLMLYPLYVLISAVCAWKVWSSNPTLSYILIALMLLTHAALWLL